MSRICEHMFEQEDPKNPGYSMTEYDLYARLDMTIRKNLKNGSYEIVKISNGELQYTFATLREAVRRANELEGEEEDNIQIQCGSVLCQSGRRAMKVPA